jgi:hypothetical protein
MNPPAKFVKAAFSYTEFVSRRYTNVPGEAKLTEKKAQINLNLTCGGDFQSAARPRIMSAICVNLWQCVPSLGEK